MERIKDFCDNIASDLRRTSPVRFISRRHIYSIAKKISENLIQRALSERRLYRDSSLHTSVDCIELERVPSSECGLELLRECDIVMKSTKRLPDIISGGRGPAIIGVYTLDGNNYIEGGSLNLNSIQNKRESYGDEDSFRYIIDKGHLYIRNRHIEMVRMVIVTVDTKTAELLNCNTDCDECTPDYEYRMVIPDKYKIDFVDMVKRNLLQDYMQIQPTRTEGVNKGVSANG